MARRPNSSCSLCNSGAGRIGRPAPLFLAIQALAIPLALAAITVVAFLPALDNGYVNWDDDKNFLDNPHFRGLGLNQVVWAFTTFWLGVYQPLAWLLFSAQYLARGLDPFVFHATSLALHTANALALYGMTAAILARVRPDPTTGGRRRRALCAAMASALYAVHPLRVEAVAWASCQPYLPCALFSLLSVWAYVKAGEAWPGRHRGWLAASFVLFAAALFSHAVAVGLPAALLILDAYPLERHGLCHDGAREHVGRQALCEKLPFAALSAAVVALAIAARGQSLSTVHQSGPAASLAHGCHGLWFYLARTCWPHDLAAVYPAPRHVDWRTTPFAQAIVATVAISLLGYALRRRFPGLLACWLCYVAILGPNSGLVRVNDQVAADRYGYLSMTVWVVLTAGLMESTWRRWAGRRGIAVAVTAMVTLLAILVCLSRQQCRTWRDSETLWTHALTHGADSSAVAHYNLGLVLQRQGRLATAASHYLESLRLDPDDAEAQNNLGVVLQRQGKLEAAAAHYSAALRLKPDSVDAHYNLGTILSRQGRFAEAEARYTEAVRLRPGFALAYNNLGADLFRQGRYAEAAARFAQSLRLDPGRADTHNNLGLALARLGNHDEAAAQYAEALRIDPGYAEARKNLEDLDRTRRSPAETGDR